MAAMSSSPPPPRGPPWSLLLLALLLLALVLVGLMRELGRPHFGLARPVPRGGFGAGALSGSRGPCAGPVDVVYTYVDGTDAAFVAEKNRFFSKMHAPTMRKAEADEEPVDLPEDARRRRRRRGRARGLVADALRNAAEAGTWTEASPAESAEVGQSFGEDPGDRDGENDDEGGDDDEEAEATQASSDAEEKAGIANAARYRDHDELRFSLRSLEQNVPWVRHVYLVTNGQVPPWLDAERKDITVVEHASLYPNRSHLPTFSSPSIEMHIHRIRNLSRCFLYLNDDVLFGQPVSRDDFETSSGQRVYLAWSIPPCKYGCWPTYLSDGVCDESCNVEECEFDGGDCIHEAAGWTDGNGEQTGDYSGARQYDDANDVDLEEEEWDEERISGRRRRRRRRLLLDTYASSLRHTDALVSASFGSYDPEAFLRATVAGHAGLGTNADGVLRPRGSGQGGSLRRVPAHMPHLINRDILEEWQHAWSAEVAATSARRFRDPEDLQYAYSHFSWLMNAPRGRKPLDLLRELDRDGDGALDEAELRSLCARISEEPSAPVSPLSSTKKRLSKLNAKGCERAVKELWALLRKARSERRPRGWLARLWRRGCAGGDEELCVDDDDVAEAGTDAVQVDRGSERLPLSIVVAHKELASRIEAHLSLERKHAYEILDASPHVSFLQLSSNVADSQRQLDRLLARPTKFVCVNDDMDDDEASSANNAKVSAMLSHALSALFPSPSRFELPPGRPGHRTLRAWRWYWRTRFLARLFAASLALLSLTFLALPAVRTRAASSLRLPATSSRPACPSARVPMPAPAPAPLPQPR